MKMPILVGGTLCLLCAVPASAQKPTSVVKGAEEGSQIVEQVIGQASKEVPGLKGLSKVTGIPSAHLPTGVIPTVPNVSVPATPVGKTPQTNVTINSPAVSSKQQQISNAVDNLVGNVNTRLKTTLRETDDLLAKENFSAADAKEVLYQIFEVSRRPSSQEYLLLKDLPVLAIQKGVKLSADQAYLAQELYRTNLVCYKGSVSLDEQADLMAWGKTMSAISNLGFFGTTKDVPLLMNIYQKAPESVKSVTGIAIVRAMLKLKAYKQLRSFKGTSSLPAEFVEGVNNWLAKNGLGEYVLPQATGKMNTLSKDAYWILNYYSYYSVKHTFPGETTTADWLNLSFSAPRINTVVQGKNNNKAALVAELRNWMIAHNGKFPRFVIYRDGNPIRGEQRTPEELTEVNLASRVNHVLKHAQDSNDIWIKQLQDLKGGPIKKHLTPQERLQSVRQWMDEHDGIWPGSAKDNKEARNLAQNVDNYLKTVPADDPIAKELLALKEQGQKVRRQQLAEASQERAEEARRQKQLKAEEQYQQQLVRDQQTYDNLVLWMKNHNGTFPTTASADEEEAGLARAVSGVKQRNAGLRDSIIRLKKNATPREKATHKEDPAQKKARLERLAEIAQQERFERVQKIYDETAFWLETHNGRLPSSASTDKAERRLAGANAYYRYDRPLADLREDAKLWAAVKKKLGNETSYWLASDYYSDRPMPEAYEEIMKKMETRSPSDNPVLKEIWSLYYQGKIKILKWKLEDYVSYLRLGYEDAYKELIKPDVPAEIQAEAKRLVKEAQTDAQQSTLRKMQNYLADSNHLWPYSILGEKNGIELYNFLTGSNVPNDIKQQAISLKEEGLSRVVPALKSWLKTHGTWPSSGYSRVSEEGQLATAIELLTRDPDLKLTPEVAEIERLYKKQNSPLEKIKQNSTLEKIKKWCKSFFSK